MNENKYDQQSHGEKHGNSDQNNRIPYWKRAHHDWRFWIALILMIGGMLFYSMSDNFMLRTHTRTQQSIPKL